jgi:hypothetical protein
VIGGGRCSLLLVPLVITRYPLLTLLCGRVTLQIYNLFIALKLSSWPKTISDQQVFSEWCLWDIGAQITMIPGGRLKDAVKGGPSLDPPVERSQRSPVEPVVERRWCQVGRGCPQEPGN